MLRALMFDYVVAQINTLIAYEYSGTSYKLFDLVLRLAAK
jgi:hypothetical protein